MGLTIPYHPRHLFSDLVLPLADLDPDSTVNNSKFNPNFAVRVKLRQGEIPPALQEIAKKDQAIWDTIYKILGVTSISRQCCGCVSYGLFVC